jgi:CBS domain-containing protein
MLAKITIADYMSRQLVTLKKETDVLTAIKQLLSHRITSAPVLDQAGYLLGIFSEKDCMNVALETAYNENPISCVADYMTTDTVTVDADASIIDLAEKFNSSSIRSYPVYDDKQLVGMISRADVLRALVTIL